MYPPHRVVVIGVGQPNIFAFFCIFFSFFIVFIAKFSSFFSTVWGCTPFQLQYEIKNLKMIMTKFQYEKKHCRFAIDVISSSCTFFLLINNLFSISLDKVIVSILVLRWFFVFAIVVIYISYNDFFSRNCAEKWSGWILCELVGLSLRPYCKSIQVFLLLILCVLICMKASPSEKQTT